MRVLIADDKAEIRSALCLALSEAAGQANAQACTMFEARDAADLLGHLDHGDLDAVLLDWELPGLDCAHMIPQIKARMPGCLLIAMSGRPEAREQSLRLGADHFVGKNDPPSGLMDLLRDLWTIRH